MASYMIGRVWTHLWTCLDVFGRAWTCLDAFGRVETQLDVFGRDFRSLPPDVVLPELIRRKTVIFVVAMRNSKYFVAWLLFV